MKVVLVRGSGDVGSAVAHCLFTAGLCPVLHDTPQPAHCRRGMAFTDALFDGKTFLDGVLAKRARDVTALSAMITCGRAIAATTEPFIDVLVAVRPDIVVDARMRKREMPESQRGL